MSTRATADVHDPPTTVTSSRRIAHVARPSVHDVENFLDGRASPDCPRTGTVQKQRQIPLAAASTGRTREDHPRYAVKNRRVF
ncbi:hypothetical protein QM620_29910 [Rhodococcus sp. IEGM 1251]|uniref:hypothetical protein n=1 Tax=unclassified Rhodococcus (in: high G+C Gram-positive bacteria) TaxID=192944 RepID=UPI0024B77E21|nr:MULTISPECIES: hypothetical protein [unclassified Rhodococcus (in: high G+C Gram-positive bacteria)]MDI9966729.1 hypothetical protein [Rhodococcus sp. IEGM 1251]MDV8129093.1 hypothetical protein [Rhodococcus sp. IEGM 1304]